MRRAAESPRSPDRPRDLVARQVPELAIGATYEDLLLTGASLAGQRAGGTRFVGTTLTNVDLASFGGSRLKRVTFEDCVLAQTDFLESQLESVRFRGCDLTGADFRRARLARCEFRRSDLAGLEGVEYLRGAAMQWSDIIAMAGAWAAALGIEVLDDE